MFTHFRHSFQAVIDTIESSEVGERANAYYAPKFAKKFHTRYLSILLLWTSISLPADQERLSNACVESWFNITKTRILNGHPANSIGDFERLL